MSLQLRGEDRRDLAAEAIVYLAEYFGIKVHDLSREIIYLSTQNTKLAGKKVLDKIAGTK